MIPGLAHAWETDGSRTAWTFHLRKEVLFHHGKVLTAEDVVYSFERMMSTSQRMLYSYIVKEIQAVQALNASTVRILLKKPNELFLPFLCTSRAAIVPPRSGVHWRESVWTQTGGHRSVQGCGDE
ncbi:ABC transporter substrate-binding protein [Paenibacillus rhizoplanae]